MNRPLFSVITPTYNRAHLLPRAINSVLNQTCGDFELIVVNDGSTDNTDTIVLQFNDKRIKYIKHHKNMGRTVANNTALDAAEGQYVLKLDDDDELMPNALEFVSSEFSKLSPKGIKILWCNAITVESGELCGSGSTKPCYVSFDDLICERLLKGDFIVVFERDILGQMRFNKEIGADGELWLRLIRDHKAFYYPKVICKAYRNHGKRETTSGLERIPKEILYQKNFLENYGNQLKQLCPKEYGKRFASLSSLLILNNELIEGRTVFLKSLGYKVFSKYLVIYILSYIITGDQMIYLIIKFREVSYFIDKLIKRRQ